MAAAILSCTRSVNVTKTPEFPSFSKQFIGNGSTKENIKIFNASSICSVVLAVTAYAVCARKHKDTARRRLGGRTGVDDIGSGLALVLLEVLVEEATKLLDLSLEAVGTGSPGLLGVEHVIGDVGAGGGDLQVEDVVVLVLDVGKLPAVDGVENGTGVLEGATLAALGETGTDPTGVEEPGVGVVGLDAVSQHLGVAHGVQGQEGLGEAGGEGSLGLGDTILGAGHLGGVARDEVEHGLVAVELGDGGQDTASVAGQEDNVGGHVGGQARNLGVGNVLDGVGAAGVLGEGAVIVVNGAGVGVEDDVLEDGTVADGAVDIGLLLGGEANALGVAATLDVEDTVVTPAVLIITNQGTVGVGRQGGLAGTRETEEEGDITALALVGRGVQGEDVMLDGHFVEENGEDALFHFAYIALVSLSTCSVAFRRCEAVFLWAVRSLGYSNDF